MVEACQAQTVLMWAQPIYCTVLVILLDYCYRLSVLLIRSELLSVLIVMVGQGYRRCDEFDTDCQSSIEYSDYELLN